VCLKECKLLKLTESGKLFHTFITLHEKKYTLSLLHLGLYNLHACPLVFETDENSIKSPEYYMSKFQIIFLQKQRERSK